MGVLGVVGSGAAALALTAAVAAQERDFSKVEVTSAKLAEGVYMLAGAGGNLGVSAGESGVFLVDDQYAPLTPRIKAAVAAISPKPIRFVLNTDWHGDHTGGNENLGGEGVLIVAHDNVRKRMSVEQYPFVDIWSGGSFEHVIAAADRALTIGDDQTKFIPGHGPVATRADLKAYRDTLVSIRDKLKPMLAAGKSLAEVKAAKPTAAWDEKLGQGFMKPDVFLEIVYKSLSKK